MSLFRPLTIALTLAVATPALANPIELITNGGFETGTLSGWVATNHTSPGTCNAANRDWNVSASGTATGCISRPNPVSGTYAAFAMNDGFGPVEYRVTQTFTVPNNITSATLSFLDSVAAVYTGIPRTWSAILMRDTGFAAGIPYHQVIPFVMGQGWTLHTIDVTTVLQSQEGQTLSLIFRNVVPEVFTGGGGIGLDQVSLLVETAAPVAAPEPVSLGVLTLGLVGLALTRRRPDRSPRAPVASA